jgi:hypothetical protein
MSIDVDLASPRELNLKFQIFQSLLRRRAAYPRGRPKGGRTSSAIGGNCRQEPEIIHLPSRQSCRATMATRRRSPGRVIGRSIGLHSGSRAEGVRNPPWIMSRHKNFRPPPRPARFPRTRLWDASTDRAAVVGTTVCMLADGGGEAGELLLAPPFSACFEADLAGEVENGTAPGGPARRAGRGRGRRRARIGLRRRDRASNRRGFRAFRSGRGCARQRSTNRLGRWALGSAFRGAVYGVVGLPWRGMWRVPGVEASGPVARVCGEGFRALRGAGPGEFATYNVLGAEHVLGAF